MGAGVAEALKPWSCSKANPSISLPFVDEKLNNSIFKAKYISFLYLASHVGWQKEKEIRQPAGRQSNDMDNVCKQQKN